MTTHNPLAYGQGGSVRKAHENVCNPAAQATRRTYGIEDILRKQARGRAINKRREGMKEQNNKVEWKETSREKGNEHRRRKESKRMRRAESEKKKRREKFETTQQCSGGKGAQHQGKRSITCVP